MIDAQSGSKSRTSLKAWAGAHAFVLPGTWSDRWCRRWSAPGRGSAA